MNYLPALALSHDPSDLCILSGWDYRREPPAPSSLAFLQEAQLVSLNGLNGRIKNASTSEVPCNIPAPRTLTASR
jgi:hypothetical protein